MTTLPIAKDIAVNIPDWKTKENITPATLPERKFKVARHVVETTLKKGATQFNSKNPVIQAISSEDSLDLRHYETQSWNKNTQKMEDLPIEQHKPYGNLNSLFLNTVHKCFAEHYPLGIRPETLMWMVIHEIGITVKENPEEYRHLFTTSLGKETIEVEVDSLNMNSFGQNNDWMLMVNLLCDGLRERIPSSILDYFLPKISTHDVNSETASIIAVLDAASPFYSYVCSTCCGIPSIRLFGSGKDYDAIVEACTILSGLFEKHLNQYFTYLLPVLKEIADTVNERKPVDNDFWKSIYNHYSGSGTDDMDGWITAFVNYIQTGGKYMDKPENLYDWKANLERNSSGHWGSGIDRNIIPNHVSCVPFIWNYYGTPFDCRLLGGFLSVEDQDGYVIPTLGWAIVRGDQLEKKSNVDGSVTVQAEGQTPVTYNRGM